MEMPPLLINHDMRDAAPKPAEMIKLPNGTIVDNESYSETLRLKTYPARSLAISRTLDVIQLDSSVKAEWDWIHDHYKHVGLKPTKDVIWDLSTSKARECYQEEVRLDLPVWGLVPEVYQRSLSCFYYGQSALSISGNNVWHTVASAMNSKNGFIQLMEMLKIRTPRTWCFETRAKVTTLYFPYPVYVKTDGGVGGLGILECHSKSQLEEALSCIGDGVPFQIQQRIPALYSLSVLYYGYASGIERLECLGTTEQLVVDASHVGNVFPGALCARMHTDPIAEYLFARGMRGCFGFDLVVGVDGEVYLIECNPRFTASAYPMIAAQRLGIGEWKLTSIPTSKNTLSGVDVGALAYSRKRKSGVVVIGWGTVSQGKVDVLLAGNEREREELLEGVSSVL